MEDGYYSAKSEMGSVEDSLTSTYESAQSKYYNAKEQIDTE